LPARLQEVREGVHLRALGFPHTLRHDPGCPPDYPA